MSAREPPGANSSKMHALFWQDAVPKNFRTFLLLSILWMRASFSAVLGLVLNLTATCTFVCLWTANLTSPWPPSPSVLTNVYASRSMIHLIAWAFTDKTPVAKKPTTLRTVVGKTSMKRSNLCQEKSRKSQWKEQTFAKRRVAFNHTMLASKCVVSRKILC